MKLFGSAKGVVFLVCDRYVAYVRMARELDGKVILCWCWSTSGATSSSARPARRSLTPWCEAWVERFASICRLNKERLKHYDPGLERQTPAFDAAQDQLKKAVDELFAQGEAELAGLPDKARQGKALRSLLKHREGLSVFVDNPQVPLDNNVAERAFRSAVIGRRLCFGSDSRDGADFTAVMYSVVGTLALNGFDVLRWLEAWLESLREEWRQAARRPVAMAAVVDERGAQARVHGAGMSGAVECRYYGRDFTADEMALLRVLIAADPQPTRAACPGSSAGASAGSSPTAASRT